MYKKGKRKLAPYDKAKKYLFLNSFKKRKQHAIKLL